MFMFLSEMFDLLWLISPPALGERRSLSVFGHDKYFLASLSTLGIMQPFTFNQDKSFFFFFLLWVEQFLFHTSLFPSLVSQWAAPLSVADSQLPRHDSPNWVFSFSHGRLRADCFLWLGFFRIWRWKLLRQPSLDSFQHFLLILVVKVQNTTCKPF